ncbi:MAG: FIST N-terminal domain-containing protein, partial [Oleiphilaceae bacterium]|nr:FIST N-terminal domain-containing protein [Oleiphilaceae bacterium]
MRTTQYIYSPETGWKCRGQALDRADLLIAFGSGVDCSGEVLVDWWQTSFPNAQLIGCSTSGEICDTQVSQNSIVATAIAFDHSHITLSSTRFEEGANSFDIGTTLASKLPSEDLKLCFILSDGLQVNGTQLVNGVASCLPQGTIITGGLAGDGKRFEQTQVCVNHDFGPRRAVAVGFYGKQLQVGCGSMGGWSPFGPKRLITRSEENVLFELDSRSALA